MIQKVVIAGGGTGGHLFPGLAVADILRQRGVEVTFVGTAGGIEHRLVPLHGYPLRLIQVQGLKGKGIVQMMRNALRIPQSLLQARRILKEIAPDVVLGVGGYASGPTALIAARKGLPMAILEQNSVPGLTNRILGRFARAIFTFFPEAASHFRSDRVLQIGNPIRSALLDIPFQPSHAQSARVLILGGSQGAHALNQLVIKALALGREQKSLPPFHMVHQTGKSDHDMVLKAYQEMGWNPQQLEVYPFIDDMAKLYARSDFVISRAGATTLAEMTALGLPSILIPLPTAADDHQTKNAAYLSNMGAACLLPQKETSSADLLAEIQNLVFSPSQRIKMAEASKSLGRPLAASHVADLILSWIQA